MPYVLSPIISDRLPGLWGEGTPYITEEIYDMDKKNSPPVRYKSHTIKPHSLPHLDAPGHILKNGHAVEWFFKNQALEAFYGEVVLIRLKGNSFKATPFPDVQVWEVSKKDLADSLKNISPSMQMPSRLLVTVDSFPEDANGNHDPNKVLVLSEEAAQWIIEENPHFKMYGTSWKSSDFQPNSTNRPVHKIFLSRNVAIFECLSLKHVPEGKYFWTAFPLPLEGASESPVCPVLFTKEELGQSMY